MVYMNTIKTVLDYIDENIKENINTELLAEISVNM